MIGLGSKQTDYYHVKGTEQSFPVMRICGRQSGKKLLVTAGIHGGEYPGIEACRALYQQIDPSFLIGELILLPCVNTAAFFQRSAFLHPDTLENLNRCFPGKQHGTTTEKIAYWLMQDFILRSDFYLDLHSGDLPEQLTDFVYLPKASNSALQQIISAAANQLAHPFGVISKSQNGACNAAAMAGIPSLLIERGGYGSRHKTHSQSMVADVHAILSYLGMTAKTKKTKNSLEIKSQVIYQEAPVTGLWFPIYQAGQSFQRGDLLGQIEDFFGNCLWKCHAKKSGVILYQWYALPITEGDPLLAYG